MSVDSSTIEKIHVELRVGKGGPFYYNLFSLLPTFPLPSPSPPFCLPSPPPPPSHPRRTLSHPSELMGVSLP